MLNRDRERELGMRRGHRYRIQYKTGNMRPREIVAEFLEVTGYTLHFSGRPAFGNAILDTRESMILFVNETDEECHPPRMVS